TSRHVVILLNGIPFNSTYDGQFDPSIIPTENIAKIKLSYGSSSVLYPQGGLGGVINIVTKKGTEGFAGSLISEVGERGQKLGRLCMSGGSGPFDYLVSGSMEDSDGYRLSSDFDSQTLEDGGIRENSDRETENLFANLGYSAGQDWTFGLTANKSGGEFGRPPQTKDNAEDSAFLGGEKFERVEDYDGFSAQLAAAYHPDGPFGLRMWVFYNQLEEDPAAYDNADYNTITRNRYRKDDETRTQ
ncbi:MAG: TonB-dependent receptor plug domain-containing protein, partial [Proteobacteria bacterium]|nr:TonB-dependent receptor plug domain-containing protein [Pseudomonadota bacterium]